MGVGEEAFWGSLESSSLLCPGPTSMLGTDSLRVQGGAVSLVRPLHVAALSLEGPELRSSHPRAASFVPPRGPLSGP